MAKGTKNLEMGRFPPVYSVWSLARGSEREGIGQKQRSEAREDATLTALKREEGAIAPNVGGPWELEKARKQCLLQPPE